VVLHEAVENACGLVSGHRITLGNAAASAGTSLALLLMEGCCRPVQRFALGGERPGLESTCCCTDRSTRTSRGASSVRSTAPIGIRVARRRNPV